MTAADGGPALAAASPTASARGAPRREPAADGPRPGEDRGVAAVPEPARPGRADSRRRRHLDPDPLDAAAVVERRLGDRLRAGHPRHGRADRGATSRRPGPPGRHGRPVRQLSGHRRHPRPRPPGRPGGSAARQPGAGRRHRRRVRSCSVPSVSPASRRWPPGCCWSSPPARPGSRSAPGSRIRWPESSPAFALFVPVAESNNINGAGSWLLPWHEPGQLGLLPGPLAGFPPAGAHAAELAAIAVLAGSWRSP